MAYNPNAEVPQYLRGMRVYTNDAAFQEAVNTPYTRSWKERLFEGLITKRHRPWQPRRKVGYRTSWVPDGRMVAMKDPNGPGEAVYMHSETLKRVLAALEADKVKKP